MTSSFVLLKISCILILFSTATLSDDPEPKNQETEALDIFSFAWSSFTGFITDTEENGTGELNILKAVSDSLIQFISGDMGHVLDEVGSIGESILKALDIIEERKDKQKPEEINTIKFIVESFTIFITKPEEPMW